MNDVWRNKIAVVTGASVGIGANIAKRLANSGMLVIGLARRSELIDELNKDIQGGGQIVARKCDLMNSDDVQNSFKWIRDNYGRIDVFINNAGIIKADFLINTSTEDFKNLFDLNVVSSCICLRETLKIMKENSTRGHIILLNSILGHRIPDLPVPAFSVYPSTKHAITALCQTVRQEIRFLKLNIKLTSINPGMVDTDMLNVYKTSPQFEQFPKLHVNAISDAIIYVLNTPQNVQVENLTLQALNIYE